MKLSQITKFDCPLCGETLGPWQRGVTFHARKHDLTLEQFWQLVHNKPAGVCLCSESCQKPTKFVSWETGYRNHVNGHYDVDERSANTAQRLLTNHWARGKTKETDERLRSSGQKTSRSLRDGFSSGKITHWAKGKTKHTHPKLLEGAEKRRGNTCHILSLDIVHERLNRVCEDRFTYDLPNDHSRNLRKENIQITCSRCSQSIEISLYNLLRKQKQNCLNCDVFSSSFEEDIGSFVESLTENVQRRHVIDDIELDVFVASSRFAVECNGLYWHSTAIQKNKNHHQNKTSFCLSNNITLMHVFEDEWRDKRQIVESMIRHRLGKSSHSVMARKCSIVELSSKDRQLFFNTSHIDGDVKAIKAYALKHNGMIVACMSVRKPFSKTHKKIEVARFACALNTNVVGALSKLSKHVFSQFPQGMISYSDTRLGHDGTSYVSSGWKKLSETGNRFWWTDTVARFDRTRYKATNSMSEKDVAAKNRVFKVWGCRNVVLTYEQQTIVEVQEQK